MVCYIDIAIIAETEDDLQRQLHKFCQDKIIEQVSRLTYMGMDLPSYHNPVNNLRSQINKATAIAGCLRQMIWANQHMRKVRIYKTCIRPIMTYGIETREETNKTKSMLRVAEMKMLRAIARKTRRDRIRNAEIRQQCGVQDILAWGRQTIRYWYAHVFASSELLEEHKTTHQRQKSLQPNKKLKADFRYDKNLNLYLCLKCLIYVNDKSELTDHLDNHPEFACGQCLEKFPSVVALGMHSAEHDANNRITCPLCTFSCDSKNSLLGHIHLTHSNGHECVVCFKTFPSSGHLLVHQVHKHKAQTKESILMGEHLTRPSTSESKIYLCDSCGKEFSSKYRLECHIRATHEGVKPAAGHLPGKIR
ncbi:zinc finger protein 761-like [Cylas formicarius]|uniref:zinc finger protein 761-like n=1 Tax=Cylas formicarius TaxID=197179 RepID=UPI002958899E|nr:zinc finger protein 761-like [Cylas formicarius]